jgi:topoisomerase IA-like protein
MLRDWIVLVLALASITPAEAQTVTWTTDPGKAAVLQGAGIADQILAEQERLRTTPMVHRKVGLRPAAGEEVVVKSGEVIPG